MNAAPCKHRAITPGCRLCAIAARDRRYAVLFGFAPAPVAPPAPRAAPAPPCDCLHFGAPTGETAACPSCRGAVQLKTFGCALYGACTPARAAPGVACCAGCARRLPRSIRYDEKTLWPGEPGLRFNPSLIAHEGGYLLAYRTGWKGSEIYLGRLDAALAPVGRTWKLSLSHPAAQYGREDPRLFLHEGRVHVSFVGVMGVTGPRHTNVLYARLRQDLTVEKVYAPHYNQRQLWEKNWGFFSHEGSLLAVYSIAPHRVLLVEGETARALCEAPNPLPWAGGQRRGGASPVRVGDEYWSWFHDRLEPRARRRQYRTGLYCFAARPPFAPSRQIPGPVAAADERTRPADQYCAVLFAAGAVRAGDHWVVAHGVHDRWLSLDRFSHADLERRLAAP